MKLLIFFFSLILFNSCNAVVKPNLKKTVIDSVLNNTKSQEKLIAIYDSQTRGYLLTFSVYETYAILLKSNEQEPFKVMLLQKDVDELKLIIRDIPELEIAKYEAPTEKRFYDGAPHTTITIFKNGEKYSSNTFDGGFPPKALEVLVNKVLSLSPEK